jgi:hypothetical protein
MAALIRIVNAFYAALFSVGVLVAIGFLGAALDGLGRGPEAVWLSSGWAALALLLAMLCFANMRQARGSYGRLLIGANLAALLVAGAGLLSANPVLQWIGAASALPFALTLAALLAGRRRA